MSTRVTRPARTNPSKLGSPVAYSSLGAAGRQVVLELIRA
jgi:hypothetical protein